MHRPPHREGSPPRPIDPGQPGRRSPSGPSPTARHHHPPPPPQPPCRRATWKPQGRGGSRRGAGPGLTGRAAALCRHPVPCRRPAPCLRRAGEPSLTGPLATDHRGGGREGRTGPRAAAAVSAGVPAAAPRSAWSSVPLRLSGHSGYSSSAATVRAGPEEEPAGRKTRRRPSAPRGGASRAGGRAGRGVGPERGPAPR